MSVRCVCSDLSSFIPNIGNLCLLSLSVFLDSMARQRFINFIDHLKESTFGFIDFFYFSVFNFINFCSYVFLLLYFCSSLRTFSRQKSKLLTSDLSCFLLCLCNAINFPVITAFCSHIFCIFLFVKFKIFSNFSLSHGLFRNVLFSFQVFGDFPVSLLLLIYSYNSIIVRKHTLYDFNSFKFVEVGFITQNIVYIGKSSMCT